MSVKVDMSIGEHYPHLFVSADPSEVAYREGPGAHTGGGVLVELSDAVWAEYRQAEDRYYELVGQMYDRYRAAEGKPVLPGDEPGGRP